MNYNPLDLLETLGFVKKSGTSYANTVEASDDSLYKKLLYYRNTSGQLFDKEIESIQDFQNQWRILRSSFSSEQTTQSCLLNTLLADCCIVDDPIAKLAPRENDPLADSFSEMLKVNTSSTVDVAQLIEQVEYVISIAPLIDAGFVCMYPLSCIHDAGFLPTIRYDPNCFDHEVPISAKECVQNHLQLLHGENVGSGVLVLREPASDDATSRIIGVGFHNDGPGNAMCQLYHLSEMKAVDFDDETNEMTFVQRFDQNQPVDPIQYENWIRQSVNQTVGARMRAIAKEISIAHIVGAKYCTESEFEAQLCSSGTDSADPLAKGLEFMDATSDQICIENSEHILKVRQKHPAQWESFRQSLISMADQSKSDPQKAREIMATQVQPQVRELSKIYRSVSSGAIQGAGTASLTLFASAATGVAVPFLPALGILAIGGAAGAFPSVREYIKQSRGSDIVWSKITSYK